MTWTWTQFERAAKFTAGLVWAHIEIQGQARWEVFAFILAAWGLTETPRVVKGLLDLRSSGSDDTGTASPPRPSESASPP
jgi:hypothetical protein